MQELQERYKDKPEEYQRKVMELYQSIRSTLGRMFTHAYTTSFLWALFAVLREFDFGTGFLWLTSLSAPDPCIFCQYSGDDISANGNDHVQMLQKTMMFIMPAFIGYISINFPADWSFTGLSAIYFPWHSNI